MRAARRHASPTILLYESTPDGRRVLNAVEFIVPYSRWASDSIPPVLIGQQLMRHDGLRLWYLHMWIWKQNPSGLFADWNPTVHCAEALPEMAH